MGGGSQSEAKFTIPDKRMADSLDVRLPDFCVFVLAAKRGQAELYRRQCDSRPKRMAAAQMKRVARSNVPEIGA